MRIRVNEQKEEEHARSRHLNDGTFVGSLSVLINYFDSEKKTVYWHIVGWSIPDNAVASAVKLVADPQDA